jgi:hypothetical protein
MWAFALLVVLFSSTFARAADLDELYSYSVMIMPPPVIADTIPIPHPKCTGREEWLNVKTDTTGAGVFPTAPVIIVGTQLWTFFAHPRAYLMIGQTQPNGDAITPYVFGMANPPPVFFPAGHGFAFDPEHDELHLHYLCYPNDHAPQFGFTLFYKKPAFEPVQE